MRIEVNGVGIAYEVTGEGRPVVLLHGFPDSGRLWRHQVTELANVGFKVIVPDLRGYGRSDKPADVGSYALLSCTAAPVEQPGSACRRARDSSSRYMRSVDSGMTLSYTR